MNAPEFLVTGGTGLLGSRVVGRLRDAGREVRVFLVVINAGTLLKVIWSVAFGGAAGWASLAPSLFTLAVTDATILLAARWLKRRRARQEDADLTHPTRATGRSGSRT